MAAILSTVQGANGIREEDGPHTTAEGKVFFAIVTIDGTYDQADKPKIVHDSPNDLQKVAGIRFVTDIEFFGAAASNATGNNTDTGAYLALFDPNTQRITISRAGIAAAPVSQGEVGTGAVFTGAQGKLFFFCKIRGT